MVALLDQVIQKPQQLEQGGLIAQQEERHHLHSRDQ